MLPDYSNLNADQNGGSVSANDQYSRTALHYAIYLKNNQVGVRWGPWFVARIQALPHAGCQGPLG